jgi:hypothetical protein
MRKTALIIAFIFLSSLALALTPTSQAQQAWTPRFTYAGEIQADSIRLPVIKLDPAGFPYRLSNDYGVAKVSLTSRDPLKYFTRGSWGFNHTYDRDINVTSSAIAEVTYNSPRGSISTGLWVKVVKLDSGFRVEELNMSRRGYVTVFTIPGEDAVFITPKLNGHADASYVVENSACYILNPVKRGDRIVLGAYNYTKQLQHGYALFPIIYAGAMDEVCSINGSLQLILHEPIFKGADTGAGWPSTWGYIPVAWLQPPDKVVIGGVEERLTPPFATISPATNITVIDLSSVANSTATLFSASSKPMEIHVGKAKAVMGSFYTGGARYGIYSPRMDAGLSSTWIGDGAEGRLEIKAGKVTQHATTPMGTVVMALPDGSRAVIAKPSDNGVETPFNILQGFTIALENATHQATILNYGGYAVAVDRIYVKDVGYFLHGMSRYAFLEVLLYPKDASPDWVAKNAEKINNAKNILSLAVVGDAIQYTIIIAPWNSTLIMNPWISVPLSTLSPSEIPAVPAPSPIEEEEAAAPVAPPKPCNDILLLLVTLTLIMATTSSYVYNKVRGRLTPHAILSTTLTIVQCAASLSLACSLTTLASTILATATTSLTSTYILAKSLKEAEVTLEY